MYTSNKTLLFFSIIICALVQLCSASMFTYIEVNHIFFKNRPGDKQTKKYVLFKTLERSLPLYIVLNLVKVLIVYPFNIPSGFRNLIIILETSLTILHSIIAINTYFNIVKTSKKPIFKRFSGDKFQIISTIQIPVIMIANVIANLTCQLSGKIDEEDEIKRLQVEINKVIKEEERLGKEEEGKDQHNIKITAEYQSNLRIESKTSGTKIINNVRKTESLESIEKVVENSIKEAKGIQRVLNINDPNLREDTLVSSTQSDLTSSAQGSPSGFGTKLAFKFKFESIPKPAMKNNKGDLSEGISSGST